MATDPTGDAGVTGSADVAGDAAADTPVILLLSGPNLNLLGDRQPEIYGTATLEDHVATARRVAEAAGVTLVHHQSNDEGRLVDLIHQHRRDVVAMVVNAGALTHYSWSLHDALAAVEVPVVELHLSNPGAREEFRHVSVLTPVADAVIAGVGGVGYDLAVRAALALHAASGDTTPS